MRTPEKGNDGRRIRLRPRLEAAARMVERLGDGACVADIGCDHGRLICALLERSPERSGIAADISGESLEKARRLAEICGLTDRISFRTGDGLSVLERGEAEGIVLAGMGGEAIVSILERGEAALCGVKLGVFQPMRGVEELRRYLYAGGWRIAEDEVVPDAGRLYQVFSAVPPDGSGSLQRIPESFPEDFWSLGFLAAERGSDAFFALAEKQRRETERHLKTAVGTAGEEALAARLGALKQILRGAKK